MIKMIIYEVNLKILPHLFEEFLIWLKEHIKKMLKFEGFKNALFLEEISSKNDELKFKYITIQYHLDSLDNLNNYLNNHSKKMREDGLKKFPTGFSTSRRLFKIKK